MLTTAHEAEVDYGNNVIVTFYFTGPTTAYAQMVYPDRAETALSDTTTDAESTDIWNLRKATPAQLDSWASRYFTQWGEYERDWPYEVL